MKFLNRKRKAQSLIEYALILAMVAVVAIAALQLLGNNIGSTLKYSAQTVGEGAENVGQSACEAMGTDDFTWNNETGTCTYTGGGND